MLLAETKPIKPGDYNKQDLVVKKSPLNTIAFTDSKGVTYPNGKEVPFDFQKAAGYTPIENCIRTILRRQHWSPFSKRTIGSWSKWYRYQR